MQKMLQQAQQMQQKLKEAQAAFAEKTFSGQSGGGVVTLEINGEGELERLDLAEEVVDPDDVEMLEDLIVSAFQTAYDEMEDTREDEMGDMGLPGDMGNLGGLGDLLG